MKENNNNGLKAGIFFGIFMTIFYSLQNGSIVIGLISGAIAGVIFGFFMGAFAKRQSKKLHENRPGIIEGKEIIWEGQANHFKGLEAVGGRLFLTNDELVFKSHSMNIQNHELVVPLNQIIDIKTTLTLGIINNGVQIITNNNVTEKFVVNNSSKWMEKIREVSGAPR